MLVENETGFINFVWADARKSRIAISKLRGFCPCAECQGHGQGFSYQNNQTKSIEKAEKVGNYAIKFHFSDKHSTGIYTFEMLRDFEKNEKLYIEQLEKAINPPKIEEHA